jgi:catechol 2,3-dioxygenase-like lactoylglutathione lyase family enzyme
MSDAIRLSSVTVNCPDARALARFYAEITGGEVTFSLPSWATVATAGGRIDLQTVEGYEAPEWPGGAATSQLHLDFLVDDLVATEERVLRAGAVKLDFQPNTEHCLVFADPVGTRSA